MRKIEFSYLAAKELEKIYKADRKLYFRFITAIETLKTSPYQGKHLKGRLAGDYSLRVGDYRIIYTIHKDSLTVYIIDLGHRREIYRDKIWVVCPWLTNEQTGDKLVRNKIKLSKFYQRLIEKENISYKKALFIYEALHKEAVSLGIIN